MKKNVGRIDRAVRIVLGASLAIVGVLGYAGLVGLAFLGIGQALAGVVIALVGVVLLATGATGVCLVYGLLGVDTREHEVVPEDEAPAKRPA